VTTPWETAPQNRSQPSARASTEGDLAAIHAIYSHHVLEGYGSFELTPPDMEELSRRRSAVIALGLPYLVAELNGEVAGFAYAGPFRPRPAYRYTIEDSIYIAPQATARGLGSALLAGLIARCESLGYRQMVAVVGGGEARNAASVKLHTRHGFHMAGRFEGVGYKRGAWVDSAIMQRALGPGTAMPPDRSPEKPTPTG
jgi:L-amino acid N-acyltransferase YncA